MPPAGGYILDMQRHRLGSRGPELSVIGYGAWEAGGAQWGPNESEDGVIDAMRAALDAGIDWIDTAEVYGQGVSETLVGRAVAGRRDGVFIATKVAPSDEGSGFRPDQVGRACVDSLARMGIEYIDLYQLHWPDPTGVPVEDTWGAMCELVEGGKVRFVGVSNFDQALIERCEAIGHVDSLQQEFSMISLEDRDLIRWCGEHGTGVVTYGPLGFGLLTGKIDASTVFAPDDWRSGNAEDPGPFAADRLRDGLDIVDGMRPVADRLGVTLAQLALAWNVHQSGVTSAIAGSRHAGHVRQNAEAGDIALDAATLAALDALLV
jgi:aryl-alcohol dehydrogenase-like predicted oxidoreductase